MTIIGWKPFYDSLTIEPPYDKAARKPTAADLDAFEAETGFRLPRSYREYAVIFGAGRLFRDWDIAAPVETGDFLELRAMHENMRPDEQWIDRFPAEHHERIRRIRWFCSQYKDAFGWDPGEVCDPASQEYAVYQITADDQCILVADSFSGFVEVALEEMQTLPDWDEEELGTWMMFEPARRFD